MRRLAPVVVAVMMAVACGSFESDAEEGPRVPASNDGGPDATADGNVSVTTEAGRETGGPTDACEGDCIASFRGLRALGVAESSKHIAWLYTDDLGKATLAWCDRDAATCEPSTVAIGGDPYTLVGTPDGIYAATTGGSSGRIMRLDPTGIVQAAVQAANGQFAQPVVLFAASDALYFVDYFDAPEAVGIFRRSLGGTEETPSKVVPLDGSNMHRWAQMLTVGERIFLAEYPQISVATVNAGVEPAPFCETPACNGVLGFATDGTSVFWTNVTPSEVRSCPVSGPCTSPTTLASSLTIQNPRHISYDGTKLFITTDPVPFDGGASTAKIYACKPGECTKVGLSPFAEEEWIYAGPSTAAGSEIVLWIAGHAPPQTPEGTPPPPQTFRLMRRKQ